MAFPVDNIRSACKAKGITLAELERALGIGNGVIARWEHGSRSPQPKKVKAVADFLGTTVEALEGKEKSPTTDDIDISDEASLNIALLKRLTSLSQNELDKVDSFVQGIIANRKE